VQKKGRRRRAEEDRGGGETEEKEGRRRKKRTKGGRWRECEVDSKESAQVWGGVIMQTLLLSTIPRTAPCETASLASAPGGLRDAVHALRRNRCISDTEVENRRRNRRRKEQRKMMRKEEEESRRKRKEGEKNCCS
jgi:hypothetical protein